MDTVLMLVLLSGIALFVIPALLAFGFVLLRVSVQHMGQLRRLWFGRKQKGKPTPHQPATYYALSACVFLSAGCSVISCAISLMSALFGPP